MSDKILSFRCPNCAQYINTSMEECRYCSTPVDGKAAIVAAEVQERVNQAYSDASNIRTTAIVNLVSFGLSFVPVIGLVARLLCYGTLLAVPVMVIRWQFKFGRIQTTDPDFKEAKNRRNIALLMWALPAFVFGLLLIVVVSGIVHILSRR